MIVNLACMVRDDGLHFTDPSHDFEDAFCLMDDPVHRAAVLFVVSFCPSTLSSALVQGPQNRYKCGRLVLQRLFSETAAF